MFPGFVFSTPKWEVAQCSDFTLRPHLTSEANERLAATLVTYYDSK
jgi:hypothetical protein